MHRRYSFYLMLALLGGLFLLVGCEQSSSFFGSDEPPSYQRHFMISAADNVNNNTPVAIDVAFTSNMEAARRLAGLSAREYFQSRHQLMRDYPHEIMVASWEIIPGHQLQETISSPHNNVVASYLFVDYNVPGIHRAAIPNVPALAVHLGLSDFTLQPIQS